MLRSHESAFLKADLWKGVTRRADDIIISTYAKFGPLRMQMIVNEMVTLSGAAQHQSVPWVELQHLQSANRIESINARKDRRILRSHLAAGQVYSPKGKYIFVGRDPRDLIFNLYQFLKNVHPDWYKYFEMQGIPITKPAQEFEGFWQDWTAKNGDPIWPYFAHLKSWWDMRRADNVLLIHFLDFKSNMERELRRLSEFLNLNIQPDIWADIIEACRYERTSQLCQQDAPMDSPFWNGSGLRRGEIVNADAWKALLNQKHELALENKLRETAGLSGKNWVLSGGLIQPITPRIFLA